jgi:hypothetical protein
MFIALLSSTFDRIYNSSRAFFLLERAEEAIGIEHEPFNKKKRVRHLLKLEKLNKLTEKEKLLDKDEDNLKKLGKSINSMRLSIYNMNDKLNKVNSKIVIFCLFFRADNQIKMKNF